MSIVSNGQLVLGPDLNGLVMTPAEFDAVTEYDENYVYELIHGVLIVNPIPLEAEANPNDELGHLLRSYRDYHPQGSALDMTLPERYVRTGDSRRRADRLIWAGLGRVPNFRRDLPSVVVEFVSAGRRGWERDYVEKRRDYMALRIPESWIFDRFQRTLTVVRYRPRRPRVLVIHEAEVYATPLLPGFELSVGYLLAVADVAGQQEE